MVIASSGGFQANIEWLKQGWGPAADNFLIRGTPYATGTVLKNLLSQGVASVGDPTQCHAVAIDGRAPKFDGGIATRLDCVPFSVVVNRHGQRFYDEGQDVWPKRYAIWGRFALAASNRSFHQQVRHSAGNRYLSQTLKGGLRRLLLALLLAHRCLRTACEVGTTRTFMSGGSFVATRLLLFAVRSPVDYRKSRLFGILTFVRAESGSGRRISSARPRIASLQDGSDSAVLSPRRRSLRSMRRRQIK